MKKYKGNQIAAVFKYIWLFVAVILIVVPLAWMIVASFSKGKLLTNVPLGIKLDNLSLEHYKWLFTYKSNTSALASDFILAFIRTLILAVVNTVMGVLICAITGYVFSRFRFRGKKQLLLGMMLLQMFPSFMGMIALFMIYRNFGWLNNPTLISLIYVAGAIPTYTYLLRGYLTGVPLSIDEAATIDGASQTQIFIRLILPLSKPMLGFIAVNAFMMPWMDFMLPKVLLDRAHQNVAMLLFRLTDSMQPTYYSPLNFFAGALMLAIPIMAVQIWAQKYVVYGMAAGAEKG
ncbi:MAG TPA: ABC transporter permease subunit [Treponemataceae bacterium]|nr:ABC transporter permease subunit [Treponemataceae bacterium]